MIDRLQRAHAIWNSLIPDSYPASIMQPLKLIHLYFMIRWTGYQVLSTVNEGAEGMSWKDVAPCRYRQKRISVRLDAEEQP